MNEHGKERKLGRREMMAAGAAAAAGAVVAAALPDVARADDGDALTAGNVKTATEATGVESEDGSLRGVFLGRARDDPSAPRAGVMGFVTADGDPETPWPAGVQGSSDRQDGVGVVGYNGAGGSGVRGYSPSGAGNGVEGMSDGEGAGVRASGDLALSVHGKATFSRSGRGKVPQGKSGVLVSVPSGLAASALVLATLQNAGTDVYLKYAKRADATHFTVTLSKVAPSATYFAWFVIG